MVTFASHVLRIYVWGSWRGGPNPISQEIVFSNPSSNPTIPACVAQIEVPFSFFYFFFLNPSPSAHNPISQPLKKGKSQLPFYPFTTLNQWRRHNLFIPSKPLFSSVLRTAFKIKHTHTKTYRNKAAGNMYTSSTSLQSIKHGKSPTSWLDRCCFSELKDEVITASQTFSLVRHSKGVSW